MLYEVLTFIKNPLFEEDKNTDVKYRLIVLFRLLVIALLIGLTIGGGITILETSFNIDFGKHAIKEALEKFSPLFLVFATVVIAPLTEEFVFRGPMWFFREKPYFKYIFYALTLTFGFYHLSNFEITSTILLLSPLLVAPQISVGVLLGFIRVRFGLLWAIALHAVYNLLLVGPILALQTLDIPIE